MRGTSRKLWTENGTSKLLGAVDREQRELPAHSAEWHMAAQLKLVNGEYLEPPRTEPTRAADRQQRERNRKLTFNDLVVAFIAGVLAAWISD
jgi:hypothetical protein